MKRGIFILIVLLSLGFVSASQLSVTLEHPFLVNGNWISASSLQEGQIITNIDGKQVRITGIEKVSQSVNVFNIETSSNNYVVSSLVVHNSKSVVGKLSKYDAELKLRTMTVEEYLKLSRSERMQIFEALKKDLAAARGQILAGNELPKVGEFRPVTNPMMVRHISNVKTYAPQVARELRLTQGAFDEFLTHIGKHDYTKGSRIFDLLDAVLYSDRCELAQMGFVAADRTIALDSIKALTNMESHHNLRLLVQQLKAGKISKDMFMTRLAEQGLDWGDARWYRPNPPATETSGTLLNQYTDFMRLEGLEPQIIDTIGSTDYNNFLSQLQTVFQRMINEVPR